MLGRVILLRTVCVCVGGCFRDHSSVTQRAVHVQDRKHKEMVWSWLITQKPVSTGGYAPGIINPIILRVVKWFGFSMCWDLIWFNSKGLWKWNPHRYLFQLLFNNKKKQHVFFSCLLFVLLPEWNGSRQSQSSMWRVTRRYVESSVIPAPAGTMIFLPQFQAKKKKN